MVSSDLLGVGAGRVASVEKWVGDHLRGAGAQPSVGAPYARPGGSLPLAYLPRNTSHCRGRAVVYIQRGIFSPREIPGGEGAPDRLGPSRGDWPQVATVWRTV